jgi:CBS domain containing-hemolysin-like protein
MFIFVFMYIYFYRQRALIQSVGILAAILAIGVALSFLCSSVEMALASFGDVQLGKLRAEGKSLLEERAQDNLTEQEYITRQKGIFDMMLLFYKAEELNVPIVIFNNIVNTLIASLLPLAFVRDAKPIVPTLPFIGRPIPFGGAETLTFAITIFVLVLFGEVIPKNSAKNIAWDSCGERSHSSGSWSCCSGR